MIRNATINTQLRLSALSAVLNICQDYEPGQQAAIEVGIFEDLQQILSQHNRMEVQVGMRLLNVLIPKYTEANEELPISLINRAILTTAAAPSVDSDQEDYLTCIEVLLPILQDDKVKQQIGQSDHKLALFDLLENTLIRLHSAITVEDADGPSDDEDDDDDSDGADDPEEIAGYATQIVAIAADVALHWKLDFVANLLDDDDVKDLIQILRVEPKQEWNQDARLFRSRAAALILGNIAQNDEISEVLGTEENLIASAISIISTPSLDAEARHATAGLLGNLAIEKNNKQRLRAAGAMYATNILLTEENVEVQLAGLKLLRQLLRDSPDNCEDFLNRVTDHSTLNTCKELLKSKNLDGRLQTEAGRVFVSLLRTTAMNSTTEVAFDAELAQLAAASIVSLGTHPDPRVKSECWMALALLSKFDWGAPPILKAFQEEEITPNILEETLSKTPDAENPTAKQDKDNVLVMLNHLIHAAVSDTLTFDEYQSHIF